MLATRDNDLDFLKKSPLFLALLINDTATINMMLQHGKTQGMPLQYDADITAEFDKLNRLIMHIQQNEVEFDELAWFRVYLERLDDRSLESTHILNHAIKVAHILYVINGNKNIVATLLERTLKIMLRFANFCFLKYLFSKDVYQPLINQMDNPKQSLLHYALEKATIDSFNFMLEMKESQPDFVVDSQGNHLLHKCQTGMQVKKVMPFVTDINAKNNGGYTALHLAGMNGNASTALELLSMGATSEITTPQGETFWSLMDDSNANLKRYKEYIKEGIALLPFPNNMNQVGPNCGHYAIHCATRYLQQLHHLPKEALPARKLDCVPPAQKSLRQIAKSKKWTHVGEIYSAEHLCGLIDEAGYNSKIFEVERFETFMQDVQTALESNYPLIIAYSVQGGPPSIPPNAKSAHWATIVGCRTNEILLATYGDYYSVSAFALFTSCHDLPLTREEEIRKKVNGIWVPATDNTGTTRTIPLQDLSLFRKKMVVVMPPTPMPTIN